MNKYVNIPIKNFFLKECVPWLGADNNIELFKKYGYTYTGICDGFQFYEDKIQKAPEIDLWKMLALSSIYWEKSYKKWLEQEEEKNRKLTQLLYISYHKDELKKDLETAKIMCSEKNTIFGKIPTLTELRKEIGLK